MIITEQQLQIYSKNNDHSWYRGKIFLSCPNKFKFVICFINYDEEIYDYEFLETHLAGKSQLGIIGPYGGSVFSLCEEYKNFVIKNIEQCINKIKENL